MDTFIYIVKYGFVLALTVEAGLIIRAVVNLARDKARPATPPVTSGE
jgi:hypothetical protein